MDKKNSKYALLFLAVLFLGGILSCIPGIRPKISMIEKRELAQFPALHLKNLLSGEYFGDISVWYADTFPGREVWIAGAQKLQSLHGYGEISFTGELPESDVIPEPVETAPDEEYIPEETIAEMVPNEEETLEEITINSDSVILYKQYAFYSVGFSKIYSDNYIHTLNTFADLMAQKNVRVVSAPALTAASIVMPREYEKELNCANQGEIITYLNSALNKNVVAVDSYEALYPHKNEYLFFYTDHHWTALGAYYTYRATCEALGLTPAELDSFTEFDQGEFEGSTYGKVSQKSKLGTDHVISYMMPGDIRMDILFAASGSAPGTMIRDMRDQPKNMKYLAFLESDRPLVRLVNNSIEDDSTCVIIKDSFGNCFAPFFTQNYHTVYAIDYRKYNQMRLGGFVDYYHVDDVIIAMNMMSVQSSAGESLLKYLCQY